MEVVASGDAEVNDDDDERDRPPQSIKTGQWQGTYLWMAPEATGLNKSRGYPKGRVCVDRKAETTASKFGATDWFSFGVMLWEMVVRKMPNEGLGEAFESDRIDKVWVNAKGQEDYSMKLDKTTSSMKGGEWKEDYRHVAIAYYNGNRPEIPQDCPTLLSKLMVACWQDRQQDRPSSSFMARLIAKTTSTAADTAGDEIDAVPLERWLEVPPPRKELTYDGLLSEVGIADKKEELGEYLSNGSELVELAQMDEQDLYDDIIDDPALGLAAEVKARFRAQVAELRGGKEEGTEQTASQPDAALAL
jgi:hypothetical protein